MKWGRVNYDNGFEIERVYYMIYNFNRVVIRGDSIFFDDGLSYEI